jgi:translocation and assembly module TamB
VPGSSEATSFITGQIQGVMEERVRGITGLDVLTVEPSISKKTGSISPRVTFGKKLMDGKLTVTYSIATGTTAEQIIKVEYSAKKGIYLIGLRDEIGGLSGAIKFRFEFH